MITKVARTGGNVLLTLGAVVGICCLLMTAAGVLFGVRPLIFRSGSMSPTISTGSLAIARPVDATRLKVGDIVSVPVGDIRIAHRITKITEQAGVATLQLKGDANPVPDARSYRVIRADKIMISVPELGRGIAWLSRTPGSFVLFGYAALMLALVLRRRPPNAPNDHDRYRPRRAAPQPPAHRLILQRGAGVLERLRLPRRPTRVVAATVALGLLPMAQATPTWAAWNDTVAVSTPAGTISTGTVPAPQLSCGLLAVGSVTLNWTAAPGATDYTVYSGTTALGNTGGATSYKISGGLVSSGNASVVAHHNYGSTTWDSQPSDQVSYTILLVAVATCNLL